MTILWRFLMDRLWDGYLIRYLTRCKQDQVDGGPMGNWRP